MRHCDNARLCDNEYIYDDEGEVRGMGGRLLTAAPSAAAALLSVSADTGFDVATIISDSVKTTQGQIFSVLAIVVPAIVTIVAAVVCINFGLKWLKKIRG